MVPELGMWAGLAGGAGIAYGLSRWLQSWVRGKGDEGESRCITAVWLPFLMLLMSWLVVIQQMPRWGLDDEVREAIGWGVSCFLLATAAVHLARRHIIHSAASAAPDPADEEVLS